VGSHKIAKCKRRKYEAEPAIRRLMNAFEET
jgi:hypothetical protein